MYCGTCAARARETYDRDKKLRELGSLSPLSFLILKIRQEKRRILFFFLFLSPSFSRAVRRVIQLYSSPQPPRTASQQREIDKVKISSYKHLIAAVTNVSLSLISSCSRALYILSGSSISQGDIIKRILFITRRSGAPQLRAHISLAHFTVILISTRIF